jgi:hypothetical protein
MGLVAVVVPAYNAAATLAETLESISEQDWRELDIVVVDDGSTDGTLAVAERHARLDRRLRIVRQSNGGASQARNLGIRNSGGAFVAPCDADDIWHRERISRLLDRMHELGPETGFVYSLSRTIDASGRVSGSIGIPGFEGAVYLRSLALNFVGNGSAALFRRAALDDVGGYEPRLRNCDDWHLQVLVARGWKVGFVPSFLTGYRLADQGKSSDPLRMKQASLAALEIGEPFGVAVAALWRRREALVIRQQIGDAAGAVENAHDRVGRHRLAGAGFADYAERLAFGEAQIDVPHGGDGAAPRGEFDGEVAHFEQRQPMIGAQIGSGISMCVHVRHSLRLFGPMQSPQAQRTPSPRWGEGWGEGVTNYS